MYNDDVAVAGRFQLVLLFREVTVCENVFFTLQ